MGERGSPGWQSGLETRLQLDRVWLDCGSCFNPPIFLCTSLNPLVRKLGLLFCMVWLDCGSCSNP